jgi:RNA polymerase primary sigma factor
MSEEQDMSLMALDQYIREVRLIEPLTQEEETRLIEGYLPWVIHLAKGFVSRARSMQLLDLIQEGNLGLIHAIEHNDISKGYPLRALVTAYVRCAILDALWERDRMVRLTDRTIRQVRQLRFAQRELLLLLGREATYGELAAQMQLSVAKVCELVGYQQRQDMASLEAVIQAHEAEGEPAFVSAFAAAVQEMRPLPWSEVMAQAMQTMLSERQRLVMQLRCGFGEGSGPMRTQEEVAELVGIAPITVRRAEQQAKGQLRQALASVAGVLPEEQSA